MYGLEMIIKIVAAELIASMNDDRDKLRFRIQQKLIKADGIGDWVSEIEQVISGPSFLLIEEGAKQYVQDLTKKYKYGNQYEAYKKFLEVLECIGLVVENSSRASILDIIRLFPRLRNKTRGHGAPLPSTLESCCEPLADCVDKLIANISLFDLPCAHLHRNISGKFRVSRIGGELSEEFEALKRESFHVYQDGIYVKFGQLRKVELLKTNADLEDFFLPNGSFSKEHYEIISYITSRTERESASAFVVPTEQLPDSVTNGGLELRYQGNVMTNIPSIPQGYIIRRDLENQLLAQLTKNDIHPIITLDGRGGVGKTSLALKVVTDILEKKECPYDRVIWLSARDIDLLPDGAKPVRPAAVTVEEFSDRYFEFVIQAGGKVDAAQTKKDLLSSGLSTINEGRTLFVFDNFETIQRYDEAYRWIDEFVRIPNKVLITTRVRGQFRADYPITVSGMNENECHELIKFNAERLGIASRIDTVLATSIIEESGGHPYIIKIMIGEIAKRPGARSVERVIASRDEVLEALFERTYNMLGSSSRRVFLTLANWRADLIPELAVEAIYIRQNSEIRDIQNVLDELCNYSFVERKENCSGEPFLSVPLAAQIFGRKKLRISPMSSVVCQDSELLQDFGSLNKSELDKSKDMRVKILFTNISKKLCTPDDFETFRPIMEYIARKIPIAWLYMSELCQGNARLQLQYLTSYTEKVDDVDWQIWLKIAELYADINDAVNEIYARVRMCRCSSVDIKEISFAVNRMNEINSLHPNSSNQNLVALKMELTELMHSRLDECDATDLSRLAWLYINQSAYDIGLNLAKEGLRLEPANAHCQNIVDRFSRG